MTSASQFSLEEENFYKDIQDLVKKGSQNEKELSTFLQRYMDLLARADLDDETFIINFTKAALILEASAKVYVTKVDRLWTTLERVLEALKARGKNQNNKKKGENDEEVEEVEGEPPADDAEPLKKLPHPKRRRKMGDGLTSPDDFHEIDNISGLLGKNMNEDESAGDVKIKFHEEIPNLFIKNKSDRRRIDVCLVQTEDRDDSRLRDWIISAENMLVKDMYLAKYLDGSYISVSVTECDFPVAMENVFETSSMLNTSNEVIENAVPDKENVPDAEPANPAQPAEPTGPADTSVPAESAAPTESGETTGALVPVGSMDTVKAPEESNNNTTLSEADWRRRSIEQYLIEKRVSRKYRERIMEVLNRSREVDVAKFPNLFLNRIDNFLIDINEVFWNSARFEDIIPTRRMRVKKTNKVPCTMCTRKTSHTRRTKRCQNTTKNPPLDEYFSPLARPAVSEPPLGILPGEELHNIYKVETKLVERLGRVGTNRNMYEAYHPGNNEDENESFLGFDGVENRLMRREPAYVEEIFEGNDGQDADEGGENFEAPEPEDVQLPLPTTENSVPVTESSSAGMCSLSSDPAFESSSREYQEILSGELRNQEAAKSQFEKSKEMGLKIANWHASLAKKLEEAQNRGAFNVDQVAGKIMDSFPSTSSGSGEKPIVSFQSLVQGQSTRDVSRYFFACLQLTNEGNVDIIKSGNDPLAPDHIMIQQLRTTRVRHELDEYSNNTSPKKADKPQPEGEEGEGEGEAEPEAEGEPEPQPEVQPEPEPQPSSSGTPTKRKRNSDSSSSSDSLVGASQRKVTKQSSSQAEKKKGSRKRKLSLKDKTKKKRKENGDSEDPQPLLG